MRRKAALILFVLTASALAAGQAPATSQNPLHRQYHEGETLAYHMTGVNEAWHYSIRAEGTVKKDTAGTWFEEYHWTDTTSDGQPVVLRAGTESFRQRVSLDPNAMPAVPDLTKVDPRLIGPITDFMTFYADLWLAVKTGQVTHPGDHFYFPMGQPSSWADGVHTLVGVSSIDFDFTLKQLTAADGTAVLVVRHVPPAKPNIPLPASWMQTPVADTPNNWVQVAKQPDGKFMGGMGQETFTVELKVNLADGKILAGNMNNVVKIVERTCTDQALTQCGDPERHEIVRKIDIALEPQKP
jgi:hypothetical protein